VADGRSVSSYSFVADSLNVGSRSLPHVRTSVLPGSGGEGYDGLLGMDFLKNFRYHVDFGRSVIEWGS
ncbi:MAG TPA: peptidase, partial [Nitrospirota bacterium]|nr:peptidase [Nitrospirota bacterium]